MGCNEAFAFQFFDDKKYEVTMQTAFNVAAKRIPATSHQRSNKKQFFDKQREVTLFCPPWITK